MHGGFAQRITVPAAQVRALPPGLGLERAVLAEPLSVVLHAVRRVGDVTGRRVLVTGAGPIGWVAAPRRVGSAEVVVSDLPDAPLALASQVGATSVVRVDDPAGLGEADIVIEASGSPAGLRTCLEWMRRAGRVVLLGLLPPGQVGFLGNA
ncbi:zinc-binding dehydrogenase [Amycolatopsis thermoflava]